MSNTINAIKVTLFILFVNVHTSHYKEKINSLESKFSFLWLRNDFMQYNKKMNHNIYKINTHTAQLSSYWTVTPIFHSPDLSKGDNRLAPLALHLHAAEY